MCGSGAPYPFKVGDNVRLLPAGKAIDESGYEKLILRDWNGPTLQILSFGWFGNLRLAVPGSTTPLIRVHRDRVLPDVAD